MEQKGRFMYYTDYHTHTKVSSDSRAPLAAQAAAAERAGLRELCVTDHWNLLDQGGNRLPLEYDWGPSLAQWKRERNRFAGRVELRLGMEVGNGVVSPADVERETALPELDFVIGSIHSQSLSAGGLGIYTVGHACGCEAECRAILDDYFDVMAELAKTDGYDVLGHITYPLRYFPAGLKLSLEPYRDRLVRILKTAVAKGRGIEVNTCQGTTVDEWRWVLALYRDCGGEIVTVGSDAHAPQSVGARIPDACELIREAGFRYLAVYRTRTPGFIKLD